MAIETEQKSRLSEPAKGRIRAIVYLVIAVIAALGTAVLITRYMDTRVAAMRVPTQKVVVAASDLSIGTKLRADQLITIDWPATSLPHGYVGDPKTLEAKVVTVALFKGEPVLAAKVSTTEPGASALATMLPPGMRAMAVRVDDIVNVAGFVHPGDHVDAIVTLPIGDSSSNVVSKIFLQNLTVLAVGKEMSAAKRDPAQPISATVATLLVDSDQAERLALASVKGHIVLALRSSVDQEIVTTSGAVPRMLYAGALAATVEKPAPSPAPEPPKKTKPRIKKTVARTPAATPAPPPQQVEILRGDLFERREFPKEAKP
jgi:pilus assembly protein CpaB